MYQSCLILGYNHYDRSLFILLLLLLLLLFHVIEHSL